VVRRVLCTCLGQADLIFDRLWAKLQDLGSAPNTVVVILGDGAEWIWNRAGRFSNRCEILDYWHALERAWELARLLYGGDSKLATQLGSPGSPRTCVAARCSSSWRAFVRFRAPPPSSATSSTA
jgi:hypothetical protein